MNIRKLELGSEAARTLRQHLAAADAETMRRDDEDRLRQNQATMRISMLLQRRDVSLPIMGVGGILAIIALVLPSTVDPGLIYLMAASCLSAGAITWELTSRAINRCRAKLSLAALLDPISHLPATSRLNDRGSGARTPGH